MQRNSRIASMAAAIALSAALASPDASARTFQQVRNQGSLRVGVALSSPWAIRRGDGELVGFEIDVARRLAEDMRVEPEIVVLAWDRLIPALESGQIDLIAAGLNATPERALHVNFSDPYATGGVGLATHLENTADVTRLEDLNSSEYTIAVVEGSVAVNLARSVLPLAQLETFADESAAAAALVAGDVDGYLEDEPVPAFLALQHPTKIDVPLARPLLETRAAFAVAKGDPDFVFFLNTWIAAREADTWLPTSHDYWFESLRWQTQLADERAR